MLVIRRRSGESLLIGDDIEIEVLDCTASQVKLGIRAPKDVTVLRREIHVAGQQNQAAARQTSPGAIGRLLGSLR
jgi:carbon storage regulator